MPNQNNVCKNVIKALPENEFNVFISKILEKGVKVGPPGPSGGHCGVHANG